MKTISAFTFLIFAVAAIFTVWQFYLATNRSKTAVLFITLWAVIQSAISLTGFYTVSNTLPPRFILLIGPALLVPVGFLLTKKGKRFIDSLEIKHLTLLHASRIPVEIALYGLYTAGLVPVLMTFEGYNFDILSGITALFVFYLVFIKPRLSPAFLLGWNIFGLLLLCNILIIAVLSAKTPFQRLAFEQPNVGVTMFPFVILPAIIVPLVFFAHLAALRKLYLGARVANSSVTDSRVQTT